MNRPEAEPPAELEVVLPRLYQLLFEEDRLRQLFDEEQPTAEEVLVDMEIARLAINRARAAEIRDELKAILALYPGTFYPDATPLERGPSYTEVGAVVGSQRTAFALFAMGEALGFWQILTPKKMFGPDFDDQLSREMMGMGYITIDGYHPDV